MHMRDQNWAVAQSREASPMLNSMECVFEKLTMYDGFDQVLTASAIDQSPRTSGGTYMTSTEVDAPQHWGVAAQTSTSSRCAKLGLRYPDTALATGNPAYQDWSYSPILGDYPGGRHAVRVT